MRESRTETRTGCGGDGVVDVGVASQIEEVGMTVAWLIVVLVVSVPGVVVFLVHRSREVDRLIAAALESKRPVLRDEWL